MPALVQLVRSPSVLEAAARAAGTTPREIADGIGVELVPASGLARLSVRAGSAQQASAAVTAVAKAVIGGEPAGTGGQAAPARRTRRTPPGGAGLAARDRLRPGRGARCGHRDRRGPVAAQGTHRRHRRARRRRGRRGAASGRVAPRGRPRPGRPAHRAVRRGRPAGARGRRRGRRSPRRRSRWRRLLPDKTGEPEVGTAVIAVADGQSEPGRPDRHSRRAAYVRGVGGGGAGVITTTPPRTRTIVTVLVALAAALSAARALRPSWEVPTTDRGQPGRGTAAGLPRRAVLPHPRVPRGRQPVRPGGDVRALAGAAELQPLPAVPPGAAPAVRVARLPGRRGRVHAGVACCCW